MLGLSPETLRRDLRDIGPGYFKRNQGSGGTCWYRRDWVLLYKAERDGAGRKSFKQGLQPWPHGEPPRLRFGVIQERLAVWKRREAWHRAHQLVTLGARPDSVWRAEAAARLASEIQAVTAFEAGVVEPSLHEHAEAAMGRALPGGEDWTFGVYALIADALRDLSEHEARWLSGEMASMPKEPPE